MASPGFLARSSSETEVEDYELDYEHEHPFIHKHGFPREHRIIQLARKLRNSFLDLISHRRRSRATSRRRKLCYVQILKSFFRLCSFLLATFVALSALNALLWSSYMNPPPHYRTLEDTIKASNLPGRGNVNNQRIYIASNIIHEDLIRGSWGSNLLELIDILGPENVFVSIYENDSGPGTRDALTDLQRKLPCKYTLPSAHDFISHSIPLPVYPLESFLSSSCINPLAYFVRR
jgi:hypothetical protein